MNVDRTAEAGVAGVPSSPPADQLVALRGELWQRHVLLQGMDPADSRYDDAGAELVDLTADLLRVEAEVAEARRAARRRAGRIGFTAAGVLLAAAVALALSAPMLGLLISRAAAGAALLVMVTVLVVTVMIRRRNAQDRPSTARARSVTPSGSPAPAEPDRVELDRAGSDQG
jgi:hypothetical protein